MQKAKQNKPKLGRKAQLVFDRAVAAVYDGIVNVSALRLRDKKPSSMSKSDWDCMYVEKAFAVMAQAISTDIRAMTDVLNKQAQEVADALQATIDGNDTDITPTGDVNIKEELS